MVPAAIFLMGPTASGKSDLALELTRYLPCDIISVDSAMVYRGMDIGTAKPSREVRECVPHQLIDICDPGESYSVAQFRRDALRAMEDSLGLGRIPLLVGGTMLYFRALQRGLTDLPSADRKVRGKLKAEAETQGWPALHARLAALDPRAAGRIHPNDVQRIERALELHELTAMTPTELYAQGAAQHLPYPVIKLVVSPGDRQVLAERITKRFRGMVRQGLIEEVELLRQRGDLDLSKTALHAVGYRQAWDYLEGKINCEEMINGAIIATRQFAKRQFTWLRTEQNAIWLDSLDSNLSGKVLRHYDKVKF